MRFIIACDNFKGTMTSEEAGMIIEKVIIENDKSAEIKRLVISDGGGGMLKAFSFLLPGKKYTHEVHDAWFNLIKAPMYLSDDGHTMFIEMAQVAGFHLKENLDHPELTTTLGVGELIKIALDYHVKKIVIGCGGSATNDGGAGMMYALGVKFYNHSGEVFIPTGKTLSDIKDVDFSKVDSRTKAVEWVVLTDVNNPLYGENGATKIYATQKGATKSMINEMEYGMIHFANLMTKYQKKDVSNEIGMGAAGGLSYGLRVLLNAKIKSGINEIFDLMKLDHIVQDYDYMILGEGTLDEQSLQGKTLIGIARRFHHKIKKVAVVGQALGNKKRYLDEGIDIILETNGKHLPFDKIKHKAQEDLRITFEKWLNSIMKDEVTS